MAKLKLGARPGPFSRTVKFTMLDGDDTELSLTFKYRTKREFGALIDGLIKAASAPPKPAEDDAQQALDITPNDKAATQAVEPADAPEAVQSMKLSEFLESSVEAQADYILQIAEGWDIGAPFSRENVIAFCDEQPGGAKAVMAMYREAITEGRLGN